MTKKNPFFTRVLCLLLISTQSTLILSGLAINDSRYVRNGNLLLEAGYTDQPYCAVNPHSRISGGEVWTCVITASFGGEGSAGEQVYSVWSEDQGASWSSPVSVENGTTHPNGLPNAYANIIFAPKLQRMYTVYNLNRDNLTLGKRVDELGFFYMRFSDNDGRSWSSQRYLVPYPNTWVDRQNQFNGTHRFMWTVDQIKTVPGTSAVGFAFTKIGTYIQSPPEEVYIMFSRNLLTETNVTEVEWELFPHGDHGIKAPAIFDPLTTVMEEGHFLPRPGKGGCYVMGRTDKGVVAASWTRDDTGAGGWLGNGTNTQLARFWNPWTKVGTEAVPLEDIAFDTDHSNRFASKYITALKNSRGPFTPKLQPNGQFLLIWYNNAETRDPYWLSAGIESTRDGQILWGQPEIVLYDRDHSGTSAGGYPDFINSLNGETFITVAQKGVRSESNSKSYVQKVNDELLTQLFGQRHAVGINDSARLVIKLNETSQGSTITLPNGTLWPSLGLPIVTSRQGFSIVMHLAEGALLTTKNQSIELLRSGNLSLMYSEGAGLSLRLVATLINNSKLEDRDTAPYILVKQDAQPIHDDALPNVSCKDNAVTGAGSAGAALGCALYCESLEGCGAFWSYTSTVHPLYGRCCPKGSHWSNSSNPDEWRSIAGGGFYAMKKNNSHIGEQIISMDASCAALLKTLSNNGGNHTVGVVVDAGPQVVTFIVDGLVCDGGGLSSAGWFWLLPNLGQLQGAEEVTFGAGLTKPHQLLSGVLYFKALYNSEILAFHRSFT